MLEVKTRWIYYEARFITYCNSWPTFRNSLFRSAQSEKDIVSKRLSISGVSTVRLILRFWQKPFSTVRPRKVLWGYFDLWYSVQNKRIGAHHFSVTHTFFLLRLWSLTKHVGILKIRLGCILFKTLGRGDKPNMLLTSAALLSAAFFNT